MNKKTENLCYEPSDQEAPTLHRIKAHDVITFAASKVGCPADPPLAHS